MFLNNLEDSGTAEPFEGFGIHVPPPALSLKEGEPHRSPNL